MSTSNIPEISRDSKWRQELRDSMPASERRKLQRVVMPHLSPDFRVTNNLEVAQGLTGEQAVAEATRCLDCPNPTCVTGCPVSINIPAFIKNVQRGEVDTALRVINLSSSLPGVCGRVCPQERQCESKCIYHKMNLPPVAIGYLERYTADNASSEHLPIAAKPNGTKIAVVGSGPAGLSFASEMARLGYDITVFEALHEIGGVLKYGIPQFRLPNSVVDKEINQLRKMGVNFQSDVVIGKTLTYDNLVEQGFKGVFVASGAGLPRFMGIPGENLIGVSSSNEYLTRVNLMGAGQEGYATPVHRGKHVAVIGGGNTAMDSVRTALRMGAEKAYIIYRRGIDEMPARAEEIAHAQEEGVEFLTLHNPIEYLGDERGHVCTMRLQRMQLGEPDESGRRSPVPIEGDIVDMSIDQVIVSVGVSPNPLIPNSLPQLQTTRKGTIEVDAALESNIPMLFAGGDIVRGGATVILAMGDGRKAAQEMDKKLSSTTTNN